MEKCYKCGKVLTNNEIGAYKKFISRGSTSYLCIHCLAKELNIPEKVIVEKIEQFKEQGCVLFV